MRPKFHVLVYCSNEFRATELKLVMETRLQVKVTIAQEEFSALAALHNNDFRGAVVVNATHEFINILRKHEIPSLEIGPEPSYADRVVSGASMGEVLQAVLIICARKRGPKGLAA